MQPYGTGANPIINAAGNNSGIRFDRTAARDAWKIVSIDVKNAKVAGIDSEGNHAAHANGLWLEGVNISGVFGGPIFDGVSLPSSTYMGIMPTCVVGVFTDNLYWHGGTVDKCDMPGYLEGENNALVDDLLSTNNYRLGLYFGLTTVFGSGFAQRMTNGTVQNSHFTGSGSVGMWGGTTGVQFFGCDNCSLLNTEIDHVVRGNNSPDGECFDQEGGGSVNLVLDGDNFHDCDGSCVLDFASTFDGSGGLATNTIMRNSTCTNVALNPDQGVVTGTGIWIRTTGGTGDAMQLTNNTINKSGKTYGLYQYPVHGSLTDTPISTWTLSGNTINP